MLEPHQGGNIAQQNNNDADRRIMKDRQEVAGQIIQEGQANTHKKENNVDNPAQKSRDEFKG
ncbi:Uncharacterised protein [Klebsiella michiganensis]|uniref:Uncharacterized protein n=1 Tax=Klebsiella michiganensis TaxID=1134687 RepID=A0A7H4N2T6_9ENTR|nr:Uncharacterised protein [Klebsiella michiganensis]